MNERGEACKLCGGQGTISVDDMDGKECICSYARKLKSHLGPEIYGAEKVRSPFFVPNGDDYTSMNVFFKSYWRDFLPHLKWVLGCKGPDFRFRILTDEKLRTVYVGAESYTSRPRSRRDDMDTNNSLNDIVGPDIALVIIRLGYLGYKNIAMPGILKEALMLREVALKPTWIIESPNAPLVPGHFAYSEEVFEYVLERFKSVKVSDFDAEREDGVAPQRYSKPKRPEVVEDVDFSTPEPAEEIRAEALPEPERRDTPLEQHIKEKRKARSTPPPSRMGTDEDVSNSGVPDWSAGNGKPKSKKGGWRS